MFPTGAATAVGPFSTPMFDSGKEACLREAGATGVAWRLFWRRNRKEKMKPAMRTPAISIPMAIPATGPPASPLLPIFAETTDVAAGALAGIEMDVDIPSKFEEAAGEAAVCVGDVGVTFEICITPGVVDDKAAELERLATGPVHVFGKVIYAGHADEDRVALLVGGAGGGGSAGKFHKHVRTQSTTVLLT